MTRGWSHFFRLNRLRRALASGDPKMGWDRDFTEVFLSETRFTWDLREAYELSENRFGHLISQVRKSDLHDFRRVRQVRAKPGRLKSPRS